MDNVWRIQPGRLDSFHVNDADAFQIVLNEFFGVEEPPPEGAVTNYYFVMLLAGGGI